MFFTENTQVVVLMGGLGTRLGDITRCMPKAMINIHGKPFFHYQLNLMKWYGFRKFLFCTGYRSDDISNYFGDGSEFGVEIKYSYDGPELLGTGGAVKNAFQLLEDNFVLIYGDSYMDIDYQEILYYYNDALKKNYRGLMTVFKNNNRFDKSNVVYNNEKLVKYDKENMVPDMKYIDYGVSVLNRKVIEEIPECKVDIASVYGKVAADCKMAGHEVRNRFYEIGRPDSLKEFRDFINERIYTPQPAVFVDRDGTLNEIVYNEDTELLDSPLYPEQFKLLPGAAEALKKIKSLGFLIIIITNQPAAAKGKTTLDKLYRINNYMKELLQNEGVYPDDVLMCPHYPYSYDRTRETFLIEECGCRKPKPGLLLNAGKKFNIDMNNSFMAGDSYVDVMAGNSAGVRTVFIGRYKCDVCQLLGDIKPTLIFKDLPEFATWLEEHQVT